MGLAKFVFPSHHAADGEQIPECILIIKEESLRIAVSMSGSFQRWLNNVGEHMMDLEWTSREYAREWNREVVGVLF